MDSIQNICGMLELIQRPGFLVQKGQIIAVNKAAAGRMLAPGMPVEPLLGSRKNEYAQFTAGSMHTVLMQAGVEVGVSITRIEDVDVFVLDSSLSIEALQALAVAAQQLRMPLADVVTVSDRLLSAKEGSSEQDAVQAAYLRKGLYQLQRILNNMTDASGFCDSGYLSMETVNLTEFFRELAEKAAAYVESTGRKLVYEGPDRNILTQADKRKLERAAYNLLSNAVRFSPAGSEILVSLSASEHTASFTVKNQSTGSANYADSDICQRFFREPSLEEGRQGLGLGLYITRAVARAHGGSLLSTFTEKDGTKITMTIAIVKDGPARLHSDIVRVDYAGGQDSALLEFADLLPPELFL